MSNDNVAEKGAGWRSRLKLIAMAIVALLVLIVVLQNTESVETDILFVSISMPRAVLLFGTLVIGFLLGVLASLRRG